MKIDYDLQEEYPPVALVPTERDLEFLKQVVQFVDQKDEFTEPELREEIGGKLWNPRLDRLWKCGFLRKFVKKGEVNRWSINGKEPGVLQALSGYPEVHRIIQTRARRQQPNGQGYSLRRRPLGIGRSGNPHR